MPLISRPSTLQRFFEVLLDGFDSGALISKDGSVLHLKYETLADIGTLGAAAQTILKYFPLKAEELVILNDPYSGGSVLSTINLMTAINQDLFLIVRTGFRPLLKVSKKVDEEGLRIPPTPLGSLSEINPAILRAIASHPQAPQLFETRILATAKKMESTVRRAQGFLRENKNFLLPTQITKYLDATRQRILAMTAEESFGETSFECELTSGEVIRLKLELGPEGLQLNFSGTSSSTRLCLTDSATFGACLGALSAFLQRPLPMNSGLFSILHVESPLGSLLNAKFPSPTFLGMTEGTSLIATTVLKGLIKMSHGKDLADAAGLPTMIHLKFSETLRFFENVPGGTGAAINHDGADALHYWVRNSLETSVEEIERRFPLLIRQFGLRQGSGGKGQFRGGHGMSREYELLAPAELCWLHQSVKDPRKGVKGGLNGEPAEIFVLRKGSKTVLAESFGQIQLQAGDLLYVSSGGGGGFGKS